MTLCQYYDAYAKYLGFKNWNVYCAKTHPFQIQTAKKQLKKEYKSMYPKKLKEIKNDQSDTCD